MPLTQKLSQNSGRSVRAIDFVGSLEDVQRSLNSGRNLRICAVLLTATLSVIWLPLQYFGVAVAAVFVQELLIFPLGVRHLVAARAQSDPVFAHRAYALLLCMGGVCYTSVWLPTFVSGGLIGAYVGATWVWGSVIHNMIYFSRDRLVFVASIIVHLIALCIAPLWMQLEWWAPLVLLAFTGQAMFAALFVWADRNKLALQAEKDRIARGQAEYANASKSAFLQTVSHELRTPLNAIVGYTEMTKESLADGETSDCIQDLDRVLDASRRLSKMIDDVLELSRSEQSAAACTQAETVSVSDLAHAAMESVAAEARAKSLLMEVIVDPGLDTIVTDAARVERCLGHLLSNAVKFTHAGRILLRVRRCEPGLGADLAFEVHDTGIGIAEADQGRLFEAFAQIDSGAARKADGMGLGLALSRKLAVGVGGDIYLASALGHGSIFTLTVRDLGDAQAQAA